MNIIRISSDGIEEIILQMCEDLQIARITNESHY